MSTTVEKKKKKRMSISLSVLEKFASAAYGKEAGQAFIRLCCDKTEDIVDRSHMAPKKTRGMIQ